MVFINVLVNLNFQRFHLFTTQVNPRQISNLQILTPPPPYPHTNPLHKWFFDARSQSYKFLPFPHIPTHDTNGYSTPNVKFITFLLHSYIPIYYTSGGSMPDLKATDISIRNVSRIIKEIVPTGPTAFCIASYIQ